MAHVYLTKKIKNVSGATVIWNGVELLNNEYFEIPRAEWEEWCHDEDVVAAITAGDAIMNDGTSDLSSGTASDEHLKAHHAHYLQGKEIDEDTKTNEYFLTFDSASDKFIYSNNSLISVIYLTDEGLGTPHTHVAWLNRAECQDLIQGVVSSVVKTSSDTSTGASHTHTVTVTWDSVNAAFQASSSTDLFHNHVDIMGGTQGTVGQNFEHAASESESTTSSGTYQTKVSLTTGTLPYGDYVVHFTFGISNNSAKEFEAQFRFDGTEEAHIHTEINHQSGSGEYLYQSGYHIAEGVSGSKTLDIRYRSPDSGTVRIAHARVYIHRIK